MVDSSLGLERSVISSQVRHVLVAELARERLHHRIGALARLVVLQRLYSLTLCLTCKRGVRCYPLAVRSVAPCAGARLGLAHLGVSTRVHDADAPEQRENPYGQQHAFHSQAPWLRL